VGKRDDDQHASSEGSCKPENSAAKHLANLIGTAVGGQIPDSNVLDLDEELVIRNNMAIASLVILSSLIKGEGGLRERVISKVQEEFFRDTSFECYLFKICMDHINKNKEISEAHLEGQIVKYSPEVYGEEANESFLKDLKYMWFQIIHFNPTTAQLDRAIELRRIWAEDKGLLKGQ
jgi:hypothetical protein